MKPFGADPEDRLRIGLIAAALGAVAMTLWGLFGMHDGAVTRLPAVLHQRAVAGLSAAHLSGIEVQMDGQQAAAFGFVADRREIAAARHAILTAAGPGGPWAGGITGVDMRGLAVGQIDQPYRWRVQRDGSSLVLEGAAPSAQAKQRLIDEAKALFPSAVLYDGLHVAGGAPAATWTDVASDALHQLAHLNSGEVRFIDTAIVFQGGGSQSAVNAIKAHYRQLPTPFRANVDEVSVQ